MSETEQVFGSREVATLLGLGSAMLRRYAVAYEKATGAQLELDRRDGRMFTQQDIDVLIQTRNLVASKGLPVDKAVEMVLAQPESVPKPLGILPAANGEALAAVLSQAITEAQRPLLSELQSMNRELHAVRAEVAELRSELAAARALPTSATLRGGAPKSSEDVPGEVEGASDSPVTRATRIEEVPETEVLKDQAQPERVRDGLLVRSARWLEKRLKRLNIP